MGWETEVGNGGGGIPTLRSERERLYVPTRFLDTLRPTYPPARLLTSISLHTVPLTPISKTTATKTLTLHLVYHFIIHNHPFPQPHLKPPPYFHAMTKK